MQFILNHPSKFPGYDSYFPFKSEDLKQLVEERNSGLLSNAIKLKEKRRILIICCDIRHTTGKEHYHFYTDPMIEVEYNMDADRKMVPTYKFGWGTTKSAAMKESSDFPYDVLQRRKFSFGVTTQSSVKSIKGIKCYIIYPEAVV